MCYEQQSACDFGVVLLLMNRKQIWYLRGGNMKVTTDTQKIPLKTKCYAFLLPDEKGMK
jgi:hypothetical protein